jgi:hypothetical protein
MALEGFINLRPEPVVLHFCWILIRIRQDNPLGVNDRKPGVDLFSQALQKHIQLIEAILCEQRKDRTVEAAAEVLQVTGQSVQVMDFDGPEGKKKEQDD